jgi:hypothetical protein
LKQRIEANFDVLDFASWPWSNTSVPVNKCHMGVARPLFHAL